MVTLGTEYVDSFFFDLVYRTGSVEIVDISESRGVGVYPSRIVPCIHQDDNRGIYLPGNKESNEWYAYAWNRYIIERNDPDFFSALFKSNTANVSVFSADYALRGVWSLSLILERNQRDQYGLVLRDGFTDVFSPAELSILRNLTQGRGMCAWAAQQQDACTWEKARRRGRS